MDKKKILAILLFLLMGFFMFTFANPKVELEKPKTPTEKVEKEDEITEDNSSNENTGNNANRPNRGNNVVVLPPVVTPIVPEQPNVPEEPIVVDLTAAKKAAKEELKKYADELDISDKFKEELDKILNDGYNNIDNSNTLEEIKSALEDAKKELDKLKASSKFNIVFNLSKELLDNGYRFGNNQKPITKEYYDTYKLTSFPCVNNGKDYGCAKIYWKDSNGNILSKLSIKGNAVPTSYDKYYDKSETFTAYSFASIIEYRLSDELVKEGYKIGSMDTNHGAYDFNTIRTYYYENETRITSFPYVTIGEGKYDVIDQQGNIISHIVDGKTKPLSYDHIIKGHEIYTIVRHLECNNASIEAALLAMEAKEYDKELSLNAFNLVFGMDDKCENKDSYQTRIINSALLNLNKNALRHAVKEYDEQSDKTGMPYELLGNLIKEANRVIDEKDYTFSIDSINNLFDLKNNLNAKRDLLKIYNENKEVLVNYTNELTKDLNLTLYNKNLVDNKLSELLNTIDGKSKKELNDSLETAKIEMKKFVDSLDITSPVLTLNGDSDIKIIRPNKYKELGINIEDQSTTTTITSIVFIKPYETTKNKVNSIDSNEIGTYVITYTVVDASENTSSITRKVIVDQFLNSEYDIVLSPYMNNKLMTTTVLDRVEVNTTMPTFIAYVKDVINNKVFNTTDLSDYLVIDTSNLDMTKVGTYEVKFIATDWAGNTKTVVQKVKVVDTTEPVITLDESNTIEVKAELSNKKISVPVPTAIDNYDGDISNAVKIKVYSLIGKYDVYYTVTDSNGNKSTHKIEIKK